ncbi:MAG TPA: chlorite dismutase family protein [Acidimicrobiales bacterium]
MTTEGDDVDVAKLPGLAVLHLFFKVRETVDVGPATIAITECVTAGNQVVAAEIYGHKADFAVTALGDSFAELRHLQTGLVGAGLDLVSSYVSLTEVSEYAMGAPRATLLARLRPQLPPDSLEAYCFYPMSKRRVQGDNWYQLPFEERTKLMIEHGTTGREFRGRILQLVTGSAGLDDYEWGVTLFGRTLEDVKECVYQMRFDEASARFAEFGPFYVGAVGNPEHLLRSLGARG